MSENQKPRLPETLRYFALALDPIHVGTGGMRLGRVDMSIVREPGTNLPKIPGTSLAGACRTCAAMQEDGRFPHCAGQGQAKSPYQGHCGQPDCPICVTFGVSKGEGGKTSGRLNLGWLMLAVKDGNRPLKASDFPGVPQEILNRAVLVSDKMFGHIVNDNLEVRTSVSIDPQTGAAAEGALYTYEALPRANVLMFEVVVSHPKYYRIAVQVKKNDKTETEHHIPLSDQDHPDGDIEKVKATITNGMKLFETLGVGGMGTRGMGRLRVLNLNAGGGK